MPQGQQNLQSNQIANSLNQMPAQKRGFDFKNLLKNKRFVLFGGIGGGLIIILIIVLVMSLMKPTNVVVQQPVTITFWTRPTDNAVIQKIIDGFEKDNPLIKVKHETQSETNYKDRTLTRLQLLSTNIGNIVEVDENWVDQVSSSLLTISDSTILGRYSVASIQNNSAGGTAYAIPYQFDGIVLAYNQDHLAEINFTEEDFNKLDWTYLSNKASTLTKTKTTTLPEQPTRPFAQITRSGAAVGSPETVTNATEILELLLIQNDAKIYNAKNGNFVLDSKFKEVMDFYTNFGSQNIWSNDLGNDLVAFAGGKVSIVLVRSKDIDQIKKLNPNLKFATAIPAKIGGIRNISLSKSLVVPYYMPNSAQSLKFIEYLTRSENALQLFNSTNNGSTFVPAQITSLNQIPKTSPFAVFSDINTTAYKFDSPEYDQTTTILQTFLTKTYISYGNKGGYDKQPITYNATELQSKLNDFARSLNPSSF